MSLRRYIVDLRPIQDESEYSLAFNFLDDSSAGFGLQSTGREKVFTLLFDDTEIQGLPHGLGQYLSPLPPET